MMAQQPSAPEWLDRLDATQRRVALVVADEPLAANLVELCRARGYEVVMAQTPLAIVQTLLAAGERIGAVLISAKARIASGLREFMADEYPEIDRVVLAT